MEYELLLVNISRDLSGYSESFRDSIGQYLIAAYLRQFSFKAYVFSGNVPDCKCTIEREILENKVPVVGFYAAADNIRVVKHAISWLKKSFPFIITIVGGPQAIALDYEFFETSSNDYAIMGEGEIAVKRLLEAVVDHSRDIGTVPSLLMPDREKRLLVRNECGDAVITDLDLIPYPSLQDSLRGDLRKGRMVGIITGRGCPYRCTFCYEGANAKNVRLRSIANVMEEIDYIRKNNRRLEYINIYDDTFTLQKERVLEFCNEMKKRGLKWFCEGHAAFIIKYPEVLKIMVDSGLTCIQFGIESGSNCVLEAYQKHTSYQMIVETVKLCKEAGVHGVTGNFIIGGALETRETIEESKHLAEELIHTAKGIIELNIVYFAPYPNTKIVNQPDEFGIVLHKELEEYNLNTMRSPVIETRNLTTAEIYKHKREFEVYVQELYRKAAEYPDKTDVLQGLFHQGRRISINPNWEGRYLSHPYITVFIEHLSPREQVFHPEFYIIRTFEDFVFENDRMVSEAGDFEGLEMRLLAESTGIYSALEMADRWDVAISEIERVFYKLNNKCLVYMSEL